MALELIARAERPRPLQAETVLAVRSVSKSFPAARGRAPTMKALLVNPRTALSRRRLQALRAVDLDLATGEVVAVVGPNGSGKSTLLRCMSGVYEPDSGTIEATGRLALFVDLGPAFHPELTAIDNVVLVGSLMGLPPAEARARAPEAISFAGVEEHAEMELKNFSSGMTARLAFGVALQAPADVLFVDEALAFGDIDFRHRCLEALDRFRAGGGSIVYVSHDLETVERLADRVLVLDDGRAIALGPPAEALTEYRRRAASAPQAAGARMVPSGEAGDGAAPGTATLPLAEDGSRGGWARRKASPRRLLDVTLAIARSEYKLRYLDSVLGYAWALLQPLIVFAVLYFIFSRVVRFNGVANYPIQLLLGVVLFSYFTEATGLAMTSLVTKGNLLRAVAFPPISVPAASAITTALTAGISLLLALGFALVNGIVPTASWLELVPLLALLVAFTTGACVLLALLYLLFRDVRQTWAVITRMLFFATPVFYPITAAPLGMRHLLMANPLAMVIVEVRHVLVDPAAPSAAAAIGGAAWLAVPIGIGLGLPILGAWLFARSRNLAERV
jgi:ABC-type polysaccharide/polyol phosphate transport system ATPase subunit/ABC-type polysaccharide/polyol phosphate export permease